MSKTALTNILKNEFLNRALKELQKIYKLFGSLVQKLSRF